MYGSLRQIRSTLFLLPVAIVAASQTAPLSDSFDALGPLSLDTEPVIVTGESVNAPVKD